MIAAGYSGTPLAKKLGIADNTIVYTIAAPPHYAALLGSLPDGARLTTRRPATPAFVHAFFTTRRDLEAQLKTLRRAIKPDGMVWTSWPKRTSGVATDITEDVIREVALPLGFVDVKVCAVDETWSGLKLVVRKTLR